MSQKDKNKFKQIKGQQVNETIVENQEKQKKQNQFDTFTGYDVAKEIIDIIVQKGGEILYDHYLDSRVPEYTQEYFFAQLNSLIGFEYKIQDQQETVFEEIKEENIVKKAYDSKCANALKVEKKVIIMPEQEEEEDQAVSEYFQGAGSPIRRFNSTKYSNKSNLGKIRPGNQSIRSVRSKSSQIQSSNDEKNLQQGGKRKKKLENIEELNLIPIQDPVLTESQIQFKQIIDGLRAEQIKLKNQKKQAEADKIKQAELDKLMEKQIKKRIQDLKTKKYTYDFDGNIIFNQFQGKVRNNLKGNQKEIYLEPKIVNGQTQMNQNYKNQLLKQKQNMFDSNKDSMQSSFNNNQKKRVRMQSHDSLNTYGSQNNNMDYKNMKMVPEKILGKKQEENWLMQNLGKKSKQVSQQGDRKDNIIDENQKQVDFYNNVQRQTSVIPTIKLQKGVAITELGKDGPKSLKYKEKSGVKKQMNRQQYLEYIENNKFTPGEIYRQKFQQKIIQEQKSEQLEDSLDLENDNLLQEGSLMENSKQMKSITAEDKNKIQDEILKKRMYENDSQQQQEEDDLDLTVFSQNPLKIRSFHQDSFSHSKFLTDKNRQGKKREVKKIHGIPETYFKGFVESPERKRAISEQQEGQMYKNKNLFKQQQYLQQANKLPSIIKVPTNNLQKKKELYETVIREKRSKTLNEETGHLSMSQKKSTNPILTKSKKTFGGMATISETLEKSLRSKEIDQSQIKQQEKINIPSKTLMKFLVN
ncbi:hypothetical protein PPERSA_08823 [Pseudocohnilembus persalinus]|uniref:Uncharacterized protein n=1 Tax=Pseudocohnilembus persalinus TaxID=266149 RepID=A0A0V0R3P8_PSEPJ|nr:hypothetical protein PPERSA_08823 [Pseudocohnilembus persalinus]|eukprot:KRX09107.1 hypothetical protein PPERSA_08823 [Pseudocohnilembus persalinus]